ncbi:MAG TPA: hypothetical protein VLX85_03385 [Stellaceae bacterium]|nr:hypothetical protein [Stellaceae bacterium]
MVTAQIAVIPRRRADGSCYRALLTDLDLYRRCWRRVSRALRAALASGE